MEDATTRRNVCLRIEYSGAKFAGWQVQPQARTVQGELERAVAELTREPARVAGASRTDAGVHALGQAATFETASRLPCARLVGGLNALLPADVAVLEARDVPLDFHARFSARGKHYRYRILNRPERSPTEDATSYHVHRPLDVEPMREAAALLVGEHDFGAFATRSEDDARGGRGPPDADGGGRSQVRRLHAVDVARAAAGPADGADSLVVVDVRGDGFLYKMVRTIVGTLCRVGQGKCPPAEVGEILASGERARAGPTAPPQGLFLVRVLYDEHALCSPCGALAREKGGA